MRKIILPAAIFSIIITTSACRGQQESAPQKMVIPESFPSDFPLYPGSRLESARNVERGAVSWASETIILSSDDGVSEVVEFYERELPERGWAVMARTAVDDQVTTSFKKDRQVAVIGVSRDTKRTLVSIAHLVE